MSFDLSASYRQCQRLARRSASNFFFSFLLLPAPKRAAMCALYAFLRHTDDLGDNPQPASARRAALAAWRTSFERAMAGQFDHPILPALADAVARYHIPPQFLADVIDGVELDLDRTQYETFAELENYCYHVASVVGLSCIHIWGFRDVAAYEPARQCGIAFQITNILRDLKEDASLGRIYLPREDLDRFDYSAQDLRSAVCDRRFLDLMQFEIERAEEYYRQGEKLTNWLEPDGRRAFAAMTATYRGLLDEIKRRSGDVLTSRVRLSNWRKLRIAARSVLLPSRVNREPSPVGAAGR